MSSNHMTKRATWFLDLLNKASKGRSRKDIRKAIGRMKPRICDTWDQIEKNAIEDLFAGEIVRIPQLDTTAKFTGVLSYANQNLWGDFRNLPLNVQKNVDPRMHSIGSNVLNTHFFGRYTFKIGSGLLVIGCEVEEIILWYWIGPEEEYNTLFSPVESSLRREQ